LLTAQAAIRRPATNAQQGVVPAVMTMGNLGKKGLNSFMGVGKGKAIKGGEGTWRKNRESEGPFRTEYKVPKKGEVGLEIHLRPEWGRGTGRRKAFASS